MGAESHRCSSTPLEVVYGMRPLRYSINLTLDGCCDHRVMIADEDVHHHAGENLNHRVAKDAGMRVNARYGKG
jgi:hypothetical protein